MSSIVESFNKINSNIKRISHNRPINIIAVSKTFPIDHIKPLIDYGHVHFGENKVQEAKSKWSEIKKILRVVTHKIAHFVEKFCSIENSKAGINVLRFIKPKLTTERPKMMKPKLNWRGKSMKRKLMIKIPRMELSSYVICVESIVHQNPA